MTTTIRIRNEHFVFGAKRRPIKSIPYERIDENNTRIGSKWFKMTRKVSWTNGVMTIIEGVTICEGKVKRFIANSWYDEDKMKELAIDF